MLLMNNQDLKVACADSGHPKQQQHRLKPVPLKSSPFLGLERLLSDS